MLRIMLSITIFSLVLAITSVHAAVPQMINYQGRLTDSAGAPVTDGAYSVVFTIYDASVAGTSVWTEIQNVSTSDGLFTVLLGSINPVLDTVFDGTSRYLGVALDGALELAPRISLVSVPYAQRVGSVDGSTGGTIDGDLSVSGEVGSNSGGFRFPDNTLQSSAASAMSGIYENLFHHFQKTDVQGWISLFTVPVGKTIFLESLTADGSGVFIFTADSDTLLTLVVDINGYSNSWTCGGAPIELAPGSLIEVWANGGRRITITGHIF